MDRYYTNTRDIWVEPETGTIIKGSEQLHIYYGRTEKPEVTALKTTLVFDDNTVTSQVSEAKKYRDELSLYRRTLPIVFAIVGVIALIVGLVLGLRGGGDSGQPGRLVQRRLPNDPRAGADVADAPTQQINLGGNQ